MKGLLSKAKRCVARVLLALAAAFAVCEGWVWSMEDRFPRVKNACRTVYTFVQNAVKACGAFVAKAVEAVKHNPVVDTIGGFVAKVKAQPWIVWCCEKAEMLTNFVERPIPKHVAWIVMAAVSVLLVVWGVLAQVSVLFLLVMLVWCGIVIYAAIKMERRAMLLMFALTFFVFLMGREFLQQFFHYMPQPETFTAAVQTHTHLCLLIALVGLFGVYWLFKRKTRSERCVGEERESYVLRVSRLMLLVVLVPAVVYRVILTVFVQMHGYNAFYTDFAVLLRENLLLYALSKVEEIAPACFCIYLAAMPAKKDFFKMAGLYAVYLVLTLGAGTRAPFLLGVFLILFYFLYRAGLSPKEGWFRRKYLLPCGAALAAFALVFYFAGLVRDGANASGGLADGLFGFVYSQGVSINVIKRGFFLQDQIPDGYLYSLNFTRYGIIARLLGIPVYSGNTVEQALYGGSFAHALSYVFMGADYLAGRGTGTSYVAELYHDFWYIGVFVGSAFYGWLCTRIERYKSGRFFGRACLFIAITQLLWAPRGGFTEWVTTLISPSALAALVGVFAIAWLLERRKQWRSTHVK